MYVHDGIEESTWKGGSRPVHVRIHLRDGRILERQVDISKGNPEVAMTPAELKVKFEDCARLSSDRCRKCRPPPMPCKDWNHFTRDRRI